MDAKEFEANKGKAVLYKVNLGGRDQDIESGQAVVLSTSGKYVLMTNGETKTWYELDRITILEAAPKAAPEASRGA